MTDPRRLSPLLLALLGGCARVIAPGGGPEDKTPPVLLGSVPESGAVNVSRTAPIELRYSEWIDPATLKSALSIMPAPSRSPEIEVDGPVVRLRLREPLDSGSTVILRLGAGVSDFRRAAIATTGELPFSTGPALDSGKVGLRLWIASDTAAPVIVRGKVGLYSLDSSRRKGLSRLLRRRDSTAWLASEPRPWREKPWRWAVADSMGVVRMGHLPPGRWRLFAWDDKDKDGYWRPGDEPFAWTGDLDWTGAASRGLFLGRLSALDTVARAKDSVAPVADTVVVSKNASRRARDSAKAASPEAVAARRVADSLARRADSLARRDSIRLDSLALVEAALPDDSSRIVRLDSLPEPFRGAKELACRLYRADQRRRPVVFKRVQDGLEARVPRGGRWGGEIWIDRDGDGRIQSGDPFRNRAAEPWAPLKPLTDDAESDSLFLRVVPETLSQDGAVP
jgi:hypothetical protein